MIAEAVAAVVISLLALGALLAPLWSAPRAEEQTSPDATFLELEETPRGQALLALKEIDFDRATGKLSESDYEELKARYTEKAIALLDAGAAGHPECPTCGPRPEPDAFVCSSCGQNLPAVTACRSCGHRMQAASSFCERCGSPVGHGS